MPTEPNIPFTAHTSAAVGETYYYKVHKSGLPIYVIRKPFCTAYAAVGVRYGSIHSRFGTSDSPIASVPDGIAHYLEHKMFENGDGVDTFARFAQTGASANAFTSFAMTSYLFSCTEHFSESLKILLESVTHPYFTEQNVEKERGIIEQEIRMGKDTPDNALLFSLLAAMYEKHPVRLEVAGSEASIADITPTLLYRCYRTFYNLHNMALFVCGNVTPQEVESCADAVLHPAPPFSVQTEFPEEAPQVARPRAECSMQVASPLFAIGIKDTDIPAEPTARMRKKAAMEIISELLFGESGDLYNELYREHLLSGPFGSLVEHNRTFSFLTADGESDDPDAVYRAFLQKAEQLRRDGIPEEDFLRCRRSLYAQFIMDFDSPAETVNTVMDYVMDGCDALQYAEIAGSITREETEAVLRSLLSESHFALSIVRPVSSQNSAEASAK